MAKHMAEDGLVPETMFANTMVYHLASAQELFQDDYRNPDGLNQVEYLSKHYWSEFYDQYYHWVDAPGLGLGNPMASMKVPWSPDAGEVSPFPYYEPRVSTGRAFFNPLRLGVLPQHSWRRVYSGHIQDRITTPERTVTTYHSFSGNPQRTSLYYPDPVYEDVTAPDGEYWLFALSYKRRIAVIDSISHTASSDSAGYLLATYTQLVGSKGTVRELGRTDGTRAVYDGDPYFLPEEQIRPLPMNPPPAHAFQSPTKFYRLKLGAPDSVVTVGLYHEKIRYHLNWFSPGSDHALNYEAVLNLRAGEYAQYVHGAGILTNQGRFWMVVPVPVEEPSPVLVSYALRFELVAENVLYISPTTAMPNELELEDPTSATAAEGFFIYRTRNSPELRCAVAAPIETDPFPKRYRLHTSPLIRRTPSGARPYENKYSVLDWGKEISLFDSFQWRLYAYVAPGNLSTTSYSALQEYPRLNSY